MLIGDYAEDNVLDDSNLHPPLLQHQQAASSGRDSPPDSPPVYRSLAAFDLAELSGGSVDEEYAEPPVYRSFTLCDEHLAALAVGRRPRADPWGTYDDLRAPAPCGPAVPPASFVFELVGELFDLVLANVPSHPDLFNAMAVNRQWRDAAFASYARRTRRVPALQDALLHAATAATPGDTLLLEPGLHWLSAELLVDKPLRLHASAPGVAPILATRCPALLRTRCNATLRGLALCRMGDEEGYPNAVVVAETGLLCVEGCRVTCGGPAASVEHALRTFDGAPAPGQVWPLDGLPAAEEPSNGGDGDQPQRRGGPQSGVWVGAGANVKLHRNTIARCSGPGVKIYKGRLEAVSNTIAFSRCGANVVANSGRVNLRENAIHGALGDGVTSWNNAQVRVEHNSIHSNRGTGITINQGGNVTITGNCFANNMNTAVHFATSNVKKVQLADNDWSGNAAGGCIGPTARSVGPTSGPTAMVVDEGSGSGSREAAGSGSSSVEM